METQMGQHILILEDEQDRVETMRSLFGKSYPDLTLAFADSSGAMIEHLEKYLPHAVVISLDHDLPLYRDNDGQLVDHGNGRDVADYLACQEPVCPVAIHSTNIPAAIGMEMALTEAGWDTFRLTPYDDLEWIKESWFPWIQSVIDPR